MKRTNLNFSKSQAGVTFLEITIVFAIVSIFLIAGTLSVNPVEKKREARDNKRITDLTTLDRAINEYVLDNGFYPDTINTLRSSNSLAVDDTDISSSSEGWINANLSAYTSRLPLDPINDETYRYYYIHNGSGYELNAVLEILSEGESDGGNDALRFELGNNLTLISP